MVGHINFLKSACANIVSKCYVNHPFINVYLKNKKVKIKTSKKEISSGGDICHCHKGFDLTRLVFIISCILTASNRWYHNAERYRCGGTSEDCTECTRSVLKKC